jgi:hypothetical protein
MENFVKLPLFLGATCLIAAGLLSGVVAIISLGDKYIISLELI